MNVKDAYRLLQVQQGSTLDEVKSAYRKLAFKHHPDLNPDNPDAGRHFQLLNEAYVLVKETMQAEEATLGKRKAKEPPKPEPEKPKPSSPFGPEKAQTAKTAAESRKERKARAQRAEEERQARVLQDILKDPFARQVFDDIYREIRSKGGSSVKAYKSKPARKLKLQWGEKLMDVDVTDGFWDGAKSWVRSWMDDAQTLHMPPTSLRPGTRFRLQIQQGWSGKPISVEVTLPQDFVIGRPIRLKGLGRKIGPIKGDLYLRLLAG